MKAAKFDFLLNLAAAVKSEGGRESASSDPHSTVVIHAALQCLQIQNTLYSKLLNFFRSALHCSTCSIGSLTVAQTVARLALVWCGVRMVLVRFSYGAHTVNAHCATLAVQFAASTLAECAPLAFLRLLLDASPMLQKARNFRSRSRIRTRLRFVVGRIRSKPPN